MAVLVISYSRADQPQVRAVVSLLRTALRQIERAVFWDGDFEPGDPWFEQITAAIDEAPQLFVFWCAHANTSQQVRREFEYALARGKRVVPVLLDNTPLPAELSIIHGIDLREAITHPRIDTGKVAGGVALGAAVVSAVLAALGFPKLDPDEPRMPKSGPTERPDTYAPDTTASRQGRGRLNAPAYAVRDGYSSKLVELFAKEFPERIDNLSFRDSPSKP